MPKMNPEEVATIAKIAHIDLTEEEIERFAEDLTGMLAVTDTVTQIDTAGVPPTSHPLDLTNVWREDVPGETLPTEVALAAAPEAEDGRFAVPQILGEDA